MTRVLLTILIGLNFTLLSGQAHLDKFGNPLNNVLTSESSEKPIDSSELPTYSGNSKKANVIHVIPSPTLSPNDIAFDGVNLWVEGYAELVLYKVSPIDGTVLKTIPITTNRPYGLTFDGQYLWLADNFNNLIHKVDTSNGNYLQTFSTPPSYPAGLAWDGSHLWHNDLGGAQCASPNDSLYKIKTTGQIAQRQMAVSGCVTGLTYDGQYLWTTDNGMLEIYKIEISTNTIIETLAAPGGNYPNGLAYDGQYLWLANNYSDSLYQIDIGNVSTSLTDLPLSSNQITVYPNPSSNRFEFKIENKAINGELFIHIYDLLGQLILTKPIVSSITIELDRYESGMFFYTFSNQDSILASGKLIKK